MSLSTAQFSGNIGKDCELRYDPQGKAIASFSLAVNNGYGDKKTTFWVRCTLWEKRAETLSPMLVKGTKVVVAGQLNNREWEKDGEKHQSLELRVDQLEFAGNKRDDEAF